MSQLLRGILIVIGIVLIIDQLWLFGIPFGPILPDLTWVDEVTHHWMLGVLMIVFAMFFGLRRVK